MAGLVLLLLPFMFAAAVIALAIAMLLLCFHSAMTAFCFSRWPLGTACFAIIWLAVSWQCGEPFIYAQLFRFSLPVDARDGPHEASFPNVEWLTPKPEGGRNMRVRASNWKDVDARSEWAYFEHVAWMTRVWHRSAWLGHWGDTRQRKQHASFEEAMDHVKRLVAEAHPQRVDWEVFEVHYW